MSRLETLAHMSTIAQAVFVIVSLIFIWRQLKQGNQLARAANANALTEQAATFNSLLFQNGDLAELWHSYGQSPQELSKADRFRYQEMMTQWLILHENIHYQWRVGLLDEGIYRNWENDLGSTLTKHNLEPFIGDIGQLFSGEFLSHVERLQRREQSLPGDGKASHESVAVDEATDVAT